MERQINPLKAPVPDEIHLESAPLVRVISQVRFPENTSVNDDRFVAKIQKSIQSEFPILRPERMKGIQLTTTGPVETPPRVIWRFETHDGKWRLSLAPDFIALETEAYQSREHFVSLFAFVYKAMNALLEIPIIDRVGLRYLDRIESVSAGELRRFLRPEISNLLELPLLSDAKLAMQDSIFPIDDLNAEMRARWGLLPPDATIDPSALEPVNTRSWILDLDVFSQPRSTMSDSDLADLLGRFAGKAYSVFRWAVTEEFLKHYGGDV